MKILEPGSVNCLNNTVNQNSSGLYRLSTAEYAISLEKTFIHQVAASFYSDVEKCIAKYDNVLEATLIHSENGLPIIPTVFHLTNNRSLLRKYYDFLEGPPIIIKNVGGAHGLGVVKVDSFSSLLSIVDYLMQKVGLILNGIFAGCQKFVFLAIWISFDPGIMAGGHRLKTLL